MAPWAVRQQLILRCLGVCVLGFAGFALTPRAEASNAALGSKYVDVLAAELATQGREPVVALTLANDRDQPLVVAVEIVPRPPARGCLERRDLPVGKEQTFVCPIVVLSKGSIWRARVSVFAPNSPSQPLEEREGSFFLPDERDLERVQAQVRYEALDRELAAAALPLPKSFRFGKKGLGTVTLDPDRLRVEGDAATSAVELAVKDIVSLELVSSVVRNTNVPVAKKHFADRPDAVLGPGLPHRIQVVAGLFSTRGLKAPDSFHLVVTHGQGERSEALELRDPVALHRPESPREMIGLAWALVRLQLGSLGSLDQVPVPGSSRATMESQVTVLREIQSHLAGESPPCAGPRVVSAVALPLSEPLPRGASSEDRLRWHETWRIDRCGETRGVGVVFTPTRDGDTDARVVYSTPPATPTGGASHGAE